MGVSDSLELLETNVNTLGQILNGIKASIANKDIRTDDGNYLVMLNNLYNARKVDADCFDFVTRKDDPVPMGTGINGLNSIIEYHSFVRYAIFNVLRALGQDISENTSFRDYSTYIDNLDLDNMPDRILPLAVTTSSIENDYENTKVTFSLEPGERCYYRTANVIPPSDTSEATVISSSAYSSVVSNQILDLPKNADTIFVVFDSNGQFVKAAFGIKSNSNVHINAPLINITSENGPTLNSTVLFINDEIEYFAVLWKLHVSDTVYYKDEALVNIDSYYVLDDPENMSIELESDSSIDVVLIDDEEKVIGYNVITPNKTPAANVINISSVKGEAHYTTIIDTDNVLASGDHYVLILTSEEYTYGFNQLVTTGDTYTPGTPVEASKNMVAILVEVDSGNRAKKQGSIVVDINMPEIQHITVTSRPGTKNNETKLTVHTPKITETDGYYVGTYNNDYLPDYGTDIFNLGLFAWNGEDTLFYESGTKLIVAEANNHNLIIAAGFVVVSAAKPSVAELFFSCKPGTEAGYTKITIDSPLDAYGNKYIYKSGLHTASYDTALVGWNNWNGTSELFGFKNGDTISIAEVTDGGKTVKIGSATTYVKERVIIELTLYSYKGTNYSTTDITVVPVKSNENHYRYKVLSKYPTPDQIPTLDYDASEWSTWNGVTPIENVSTGQGLIVVECDSNNKVQKYGVITINAADPKPTLKTLDIVSEAGEELGFTKITVEEELEEGYSYRYNINGYIPEVDEYDYDVSEWEIWDGETEFECNTGDTIVIGVATTDMKLIAVGSVAAVVNTGEAPEEPEESNPEPEEPEEGEPEEEVITDTEEPEEPIEDLGDSE